MNKIAAQVALSAALVALCSSASAQQPKKIPRIGYLASSDAATASATTEGIRLALREAGYIEGQNIAIEYAGGITWIRDAKNATKTIPIVMVGAGNDPVQAGLIESLARPGGNVTGLTNLSGQLGAKQLELLKEAVPKIRRVGVLYEAATPANVTQLKEVQAAARTLHLTVQAWEVRDADGFEKLFVAMNKEPPHGIHVLGSPLINSNRKQIADLALTSRLSSAYESREAVDAGGLMSYGADLAESYGRVATYVDRILKGAKPADLPVEQPTKFEMVINLRTAQQIGLTIPPNVLARADRVIR